MTEHVLKQKQFCLLQNLIASAEGDLYSQNALIFFALCLVQKLLLYMHCDIYSYGGFLTVSVSDTPITLFCQFNSRSVFSRCCEMKCYSSSWSHFLSAYSDLIRLINKTKWHLFYTKCFEMRPDCYILFKTSYQETFTKTERLPRSSLLYKLFLERRGFLLEKKKKANKQKPTTNQTVFLLKKKKIFCFGF